jgi:hypothetical protein
MGMILETCAVIPIQVTGVLSHKSLVCCVVAYFKVVSARSAKRKTQNVAAVGHSGPRCYGPLRAG